MAKKKPKAKRPALALDAQVKIAEGHLQARQPAQAIAVLTRVEAEIRRLTSQGRGKVPPDVLKLQPATAALMARAFFVRALGSAELSARAGDLQEALAREPLSAAYLLAIGACDLAAGQGERALGHLQKARAAAPEDKLIERAYLLGLLAAGKTREVREHIKALPEEQCDDALRRIAAMRELAVGNFAKAEARLRAQAAAPLAHHLLSSLTSLAAGHFADAQKQLGELPALAHNPSPPEAAVLATQCFYQGALLFALHHVESAANALTEAERVAQCHALTLPWLPHLPAYYHKIAEAAVENDNPALAIRCWQGILAIDPNDKAAMANLAMAQRAAASQAWRKGDPEHALISWQEALKFQPQDATLWQNAAIACEKLARPEEALSYWHRLVQRWRQEFKQDPGDTARKERLLALEKHLIEQMIKADRPNREIFAELDAALKLDPSDHDLRRRLIELYLEAGNPKQALKQIEILEQRAQVSADVLAQKGMALEMARKPQAARQCFARALELQPNHLMARKAYIRSLDTEAKKAWQNKNYAQAIALCQQQTAIDPAHVPAYVNMANLYFDQHDRANAEQALARAIAIKPDSAPIHITVGRAYLERGYDKRASEAFNKATALDASAECYFEIGATYLDVCRHKEGVTYFEQAAKTAALELFMEMLMLLSGHSGDRKVDKAFECLAKAAIQKDPLHPLPHLIRVPMLMDKAAFEEAMQAAETAERLATGKKEFDFVRKEAATLKKTIRDLQQLAGQRIPAELLQLLSRGVRG